MAASAGFEGGRRKKGGGAKTVALRVTKKKAPSHCKMGGNAKHRQLSTLAQKEGSKRKKPLSPGNGEERQRHAERIQEKDDRKNHEKK